MDKIETQTAREREREGPCSEENHTKTTISHCDEACQLNLATYSHIHTHTHTHTHVCV